MRCRRVGQPERAAQPLHGELDDARADTASAPGADEHRAVVRLEIDRGTSRHSPATSSSTFCSTGTMRVLLPLPVTIEHVARAGRRHLAAFQAQRFGDAQAGAVEQRHHGGVTRQIQGSRSSPARSGRRRQMRLAAGMLSGFGRVLPTFGARIAIERADLALALAVRGSAERAQRRPATASASGAPMSPARRMRHEGADVCWSRAAANCASARRASRPSVRSGKPGTGRRSRRIGLERLRRQPPFGCADA